MKKKELGKLVWQFATELTTHVKGGMKTVDPATFKKRLSTCMECDKYLNGLCVLCGCNMKVKTKWKTSRCAMNPPKWEREDDGS